MAAGARRIADVSDQTLRAVLIDFLVVDIEAEIEMSGQEFFGSKRMQEAEETLGLSGYIMESEMSTWRLTRAFVTLEHLYGDDDLLSDLLEVWGEEGMMGEVTALLRDRFRANTTMLQMKTALVPQSLDHKGPLALAVDLCCTNPDRCGGLCAIA